MSDDSMPKWLAIKKAAEHLDISDKTVRRMIARGDLKARRIGKRLLRVDRDSLLAHGRPVGGAA